jgi:plastocyanin
MPTRPGVLLLPLLTAALLAGCDRAERAPEPASRGADATDVNGAPAGAEAGPHQVDVVLGEWTIGLGRDELPAGRTTFRIRNAGEHDHVFEIERGDQEWETETIPPGGSAELTVNLEPGEYEVYCPVVGDAGSHRELGMETRLVVR